MPGSVSKRAAEAGVAEPDAVSDKAPVSDSGGAHGVRHLAIIMDGNGRWATRRGFPRVAGHRAGLEAVRRLVKAAIARGIRYLTIYSFSTENWARPAEEVGELMSLLKFFIRADLSSLNKQNVRVRLIGEREGLSPDILSLLEEAETTTRANTGMTFIVAFNYGARAEMLRAMRHLASEAAAGRLDPTAISEETFGRALDTADIPDPDMMIRTSGEQRISNFLLWQSAYTEFYFTPVLWPDFDEAALDQALAEFGRRHRRFGGI